MSDELFETRKGSFAAEGELSAFNLACVAEALDTIKSLADENTGGETVEKRIGEYKSWDPEIYKVDKETEDGFVDHAKIDFDRWARLCVSPPHTQVDRHVEHPGTFRKVHSQEENVAPRAMGQVHSHGRPFP